MEALAQQWIREGGGDRGDMRGGGRREKAPCAMRNGLSCEKERENKTYKYRMERERENADMVTGGMLFVFCSTDHATDSFIFTMHLVCIYSLLSVFATSTSPSHPLQAKRGKSVGTSSAKAQHATTAVAAKERKKGGASEPTAESEDNRSDQSNAASSAVRDESSDEDDDSDLPEIMLE